MNLLQKPTSLLPLFVLTTGLLHLVILGLNLLSLGKLDKLSRSEYLTQLHDGSTVKVKVDTEPTTEVIKAFATVTLSDIMTSRVELTPTKTDTGVDVGTGKVTTSSFNGSFGLSEDFRQKFLESRAKNTPSGVFAGTVQQLLLIKRVAKPIKIEKDKWRVDMVAQLLLFRSKERVKSLPFYRSIFIRRSEIPTLPKNPTELEQIIYNARKNGLEIYLIKELKP